MVKAIAVALIDHSKTKPLEFRISKCSVFQCLVLKPPILTEFFNFILERLPPAVSDAVKHKMLSLDNLRDSLPDFGREEVSKLIN